MKFEEKLAQAFKETLDERTERLMKVEKKHRFSLSYKLWERKMLRDLRRNRVDRRWTLRRARYAVTAMFAAFALLIGGTAYGAVVMSRRFMPEDMGYYVNMLIEKSPSDKSTFEEYYGLPEEDGWVLIDHYFYFEDTELSLKYMRGDTPVIFRQILIPERRAAYVDNGKGNIETWSFYSEDDGFVVNLKNNRTKIYWLYDGYLFEIYSDMDKNEVIKLVYSTKIIDLPLDF